MPAELKDPAARRPRRLPDQVAELERIVAMVDDLASRVRDFLEDHPHGCGCPTCLALGVRDEGFPGMLDLLLGTGTFLWSMECHLRMGWPAARNRMYVELAARTRDRRKAGG